MQTVTWILYGIYCKAAPHDSTVASFFNKNEDEMDSEVAMKIIKNEPPDVRFQKISLKR